MGRCQANRPFTLATGAEKSYDWLIQAGEYVAARDYADRIALDCERRGSDGAAFAWAMRARKAAQAAYNIGYTDAFDRPRE